MISDANIELELKKGREFEMNRAMKQRILANLRGVDLPTDQSHVRKIRRWAGSAVSASAAVVVFGVALIGLHHISAVKSDTNASQAVPEFVANELVLPRGVLPYQPIRLDNSIGGKYRYMSSVLWATPAMYSVTYAEGLAKNSNDRITIREEPTSQSDGPLSGTAALIGNPLYESSWRTKDGIYVSSASNSNGTAVGYVLNHVAYQIMAKKLNAQDLANLISHLTVSAGSVTEIDDPVGTLQKYKKGIHLPMVVPKPPTGYTIASCSAVGGAYGDPYHSVYITYRTKKHDRCIQISETPIENASNYSESQNIMKVVIAGHPVNTFKPLPPISTNSQYFWGNPRKKIWFEVDTTTPKDASALRSVVSALFK